jgi:hypothetical protein
MKKSVIVGLCVIALIALVFQFRSEIYSAIESGVKGNDLEAAIFNLQRGGYSDVKVIETYYMTAIPPGFEPNGAGSVVVGALDSFTASAQKAGKTVTLKVLHVGLPTEKVEVL